MMKNTSKGYIILFVAWLAACTDYACIQQLSPISAFIIADLGLSSAQMGILYSIPTIMFALVAFLGGAASDKYGAINVACAGITMIALAALSRGFTSVSYWPLLVSNLILGVGSGLVLPNLPKMTGMNLPEKKRAFATSIYSTGISVGSSLGLMLTIPVINHLTGTWQNSFYFWGLCAICIAVIMWIVRSQYGQKQNIIRSSNRLFDPEIYKNKKLWIAAVNLFFLVWLFFAVLGWVPRILSAKGVESSQAGIMSGLVPLFGLLANFFTPMISTKVKNRTLFIKGAFLISSLTIIFMIYGSANSFWVLLPIIGYALNMGFVLCMFILPGDLVKQKNLGAATGLVMTIGYAGSLIGSTVSGMLWDYSQKISMVLLGLFVVAVLGLIVSHLIPEPFQKQNMTYKDEIGGNKSCKQI